VIAVWAELLLHVLEALGELGEVELRLGVPAGGDGVEGGGPHREPELLLREEEGDRNGLVVLLRGGIAIPPAAGDLEAANLGPHRGHDQEADRHRHQVDEGDQVDGGIQGLLRALGVAEIHPSGHA